MDDTVKFIVTFVDAVALVLALILMLSLLHRNELYKRGCTGLLGAMFSFTILMSMSDPIDLGANGFFDMWGLLIGTAVALMGPVVGLMAAATGLACRFSIGGPGLESGIALIVGAYAGGVLWRLTIKDLDMIKWQKSVILGVFISVQSVGIFFAPTHMQISILTGLVPFIVISSIIGALIINHLISGELSFLSEAETSKIEATTDHLTGLVNRRGLDTIFPNLSGASSGNKGRGMLYFDIDRFKLANDSHGHAFGDEVLKQVAERVAGNLRQNDIFARVGGDEFVVVLPKVDKKEAQHIADRCRSIVAEDLFEIDGKSIPVTISLGAIWVHSPTDIDQMLDAADRALYQAKSSGRNAVIFLSNLNANRGEAALTPAV